MRTQLGAIFRDRDEGRGPETEVALAETERDPLADFYSNFRRRARGEDPDNEGDDES